MNNIKKYKGILIILAIVIVILAIIYIILINYNNVDNTNLNKQNSLKSKIDVKEHDYKLCEFALDNCNGCDVMNPIFEEIKVMYKDKLEFEYIDVEYMPNLANKYIINTAPTFIIIDKDGKVKARSEGVISKEEFVKLVESVLDN